MKRDGRDRLVLLAVLGVAAALVAVLASSASGRAGAAPANTKEPSVSGVALVGNTLTLDRGTWTGKQPITYTYQWGRCDENGGNCTAISGAAETTYVLTNADVGHTIRARVNAKNADGTTSANANATGVVSTENGSPANSKPPTISGTPVVGSDLTASTGSWVGTQPITYAYRWRRCDQAGNACKDISGQTKATYLVAKADVGKTIRIKVLATNNRGKSSAFSEQTAVVEDTGGGGGGNIINLPNGEKSVPAADVAPAGERLIVDQVQFTPNPVSSRNEPIEVRIKVKDTSNHVVRGAYVFIRSTPILTSTPTDAPTGTNGWVTYHITPRSDFPLKTGYNVQFFVKAYRQGDPSLAGISGTRLVQVATVTP
jgi:hypothetical protein